MLGLLLSPSFGSRKVAFSTHSSFPLYWLVFKTSSVPCWCPFSYRRRNVREAVSSSVGTYADSDKTISVPPVCSYTCAKVRVLLAKSRIEVGQYARGLTDCHVASRLLREAETLLEEREAEEVCTFGVGLSSGISASTRYTRCKSRWISR